MIEICDDDEKMKTFTLKVVYTELNFTKFSVPTHNCRYETYDAPYTGTCNCNNTLWHTRSIPDAYRHFLIYQFESGERNTHRTPEH